MNLIAKHLLISGKVHGVFFRKTTKHKAHELNIYGWVKNTADKKVEIVAQGNEESIDKFISWCKEGPSHAEVNNVQVEEEVINQDLKDFSIVYAD